MSDEIKYADESAGWEDILTDVEREDPILIELRDLNNSVRRMRSYLVWILVVLIIIGLWIAFNTH